MQGVDVQVYRAGKSKNFQIFRTGKGRIRTRIGIRKRGGQMVSGEPEVFEEEDVEVFVQSNRSSHLLKKGIVTGRDFANVMSALMTDLADGSITPPVGNAISKAGSQMLKMVELQYRYAPPKRGEIPNLPLADRYEPSDSESDK